MGALSAISVCGGGATAGITSIGRLPGGSWSTANGVSGDGMVIVGASDSPEGRRAVRWTRQEGMQSLGTLGGNESEALGISKDGQTIVGESDSPEGPRAFRWTGSSGMLSLGVLPGAVASSALGVNEDGRVIAGYCTFPTGERAFRWTPEGGLVDLGTLAGGGSSRATAVSRDGSIIVGWSGPEGLRRPFRWAAGTMQDLGVAVGYAEAVASDVNDWGGVVVGYVFNGASDSNGFQWTQHGGISLRGPQWPGRWARVLSCDGTGGFKVGVSGTADGSVAMGWDARYARGIFAFDPDAGLWTSSSAHRVSADGSTVVGVGTRSGLREGWVVGPVLLCDPDLNRDGAVDEGDVRAWYDSWSADNPLGIDPDFNRDGNADQDDVADLINVVAGGSCPW